MGNKSIPKITTVGNEDLFKLLKKVVNESDGTIKTTEAMEIEKIGCLVHVITERKNNDGVLVTSSEALTFVPNVKIVKDINGGKKLEWRYTT